MCAGGAFCAGAFCAGATAQTRRAAQAAHARRSARSVPCSPAARPPARRRHRLSAWQRSRRRVARQHHRAGNAWPVPPCSAAHLGYLPRGRPPRVPRLRACDRQVRRRALMPSVVCVRALLRGWRTTHPHLGRTPCSASRRAVQALAPTLEAPLRRRLKCRTTETARACESGGCLRKSPPRKAERVQRRVRMMLVPATPKPQGPRWCRRRRGRR
jgi:hypothetical protein